MIHIGDRVRVSVDAGSFQLKQALGTVVHVYHEAIYIHHLCPIQVELDEPYNEDGHKVIRCSLKEIQKEDCE